MLSNIRIFTSALSGSSPRLMAFLASMRGTTLCVRRCLWLKSYLLVVEAQSCSPVVSWFDVLIAKWDDASQVDSYIAMIRAPSEIPHGGSVLEKREFMSSTTALPSE
jgi:hypothetical protein